MRALLIAVVALALAGEAQAVTCVGYYCIIDNGSAPPNPENVIADATYWGDRVHVRNVGCPPGWPGSGGDPSAPCPSPGDLTAVAFMKGGEVAELNAYDTSTVTMSGGKVMYGVAAHDSSAVTMTGGEVALSLHARDSSTVAMNGGTLDSSLNAHDTSTVTMNGGTVVYGLYAYDTSTVTMSGGSLVYGLCADDSSRVTIVGRDFEVDGSPIPYGDLTAQFGWLTGTLASGEPISNDFSQGSVSWTGTITLEYAPEPHAVLLGGFVLLTLALLRRCAPHGRDSAREP